MVPPIVWVSSHHTEIPAKLGADCSATGATFASWNVRHSTLGLSDIFIFDGRHSAINGFYDTDHFGTYYVEPRSSWNTFYDLTQNTASYVVKSGSTVGVSASRLGRALTLRVAVTYYSPAAGTFTPWRNKRVLIQYNDKACGPCAWKGRATLVTDSNGIATFSSNSPYLRYYRAVTAEALTIWGRSSVVALR